MTKPYGDAIVVGGSVAGMLAAGALAEHFERILIVDRDVLPFVANARRSVPQGRHAHALLVRGVEAMEELFPGFSAEAVAAGAIEIDPVRDVSWGMAGVHLRRTVSGLRVVMATRPLLEALIRARLARLANVTMLPRTTLTGLILHDGAVTGVRLQNADGDDERDLQADLVVDASGRSARTAAILSALGFPEPRRSEIHVGIGYATHLFAARPDRLGDRKVVIVGATPACPRSGVVHLVEGGRIEVSLGGYRGHHPPSDLAGFVAHARSLALPDIYDLVHDAEPSARLPSTVCRARYAGTTRRSRTFPPGSSSSATRCARSIRCSRKG